MKGPTTSRRYDWHTLQIAVDREDLQALRDYVHSVNQADPSILTNPLDALARHTYYRLAAASAPPTPVSSWPSSAEGSSLSSSRGESVWLSGPMGSSATAGGQRATNRGELMRSRGYLETTSRRSAADIRLAVDSILVPPPAVLRQGGASLSAREQEERADIADLEQYEAQIIQQLAGQSVRTVLRREGSRQLARLELEEAAARERVEAAYSKAASSIQVFLGAWRRGPAMEQNNLLISEGLTRARIEGEEHKARQAMAGELSYVADMKQAELSRLWRLQLELSKASLLHQRVTFLDAMLLTDPMRDEPAAPEVRRGYAVAARPHQEDHHQSCNTQ